MVAFGARSVDRVSPSPYCRESIATPDCGVIEYCLGIAHSIFRTQIDWCVPETVNASALFRHGNRDLEQMLVRSGTICLPCLRRLQQVGKPHIVEKLLSNTICNSVYNLGAIVCWINVHPKRPRPKWHVYHLDDRLGYI